MERMPLVRATGRRFFVVSGRCWLQKGLQKWVMEFEWDVQGESLFLCSEHRLLAWVVG